MDSAGTSPLQFNDSTSTSVEEPKIFGLSGLFLILIALVSGGRLLERTIELMSDPGFLLQSGFWTLIIGVAIVVGHNVWDGSWRVVITVVGYLSLVKGFIILVWPDAFVEMSKGYMESGVMPVHLLGAAAFYGWLAWLGFRPERGEIKSQPDGDG